MGPSCRIGEHRLVWLTKKTGTSFSSFLPMQHDGGVATNPSFASGRRDSQGRLR